MGTTRLGGDKPLPKPPADRGRQGTTLGVAPSATIPRGDPFAPDAAITTVATSHYTCATCGDVVLPEGTTRFCGVCGGPVKLKAEVVASVSAPANAAPQVAISVTLQQPTAAPTPHPAPADHSKTGAATQKLPAAQPKRKGQRTLLGELQTLRLVQSLEDKAELTNLGKAAGLILLLLLLGFIGWAVYDGRSRRRPSVTDSGPSLNISIPLTDASTED